MTFRPRTKVDRHCEARNTHCDASEPLSSEQPSPSLQQTDKVGKAFKYLDAALSFIECGITMELDTFSPKPAYTMFAETIDLIK